MTEPPMRWETRSPSASCPYRRDTPLAFWDASEFINLLQSNRDPFGGLFGCHGTRKLPEGPAICAGWLLDQVKRDLPCMTLRLALIRNPEGVAALKEVHANGLELYDSVEAMCIRNLRQMTKKPKGKNR